MFTSQFFQSTSEKAETLDLEVLNDALSFAIKKYTGQIFREYGYARWSHGPSLKYIIK
jgi:hypothetical protein